MSDDRDALPPKQDPESLVLRARPRPVARFRRGIIVAASACVSGTVIALAWFALDPPSLRVAAERNGAIEERRSGAPDAIADAPGSYAEIPQLGPPLPGDLGAPILEQQRREQERFGLEGSGSTREEALAVERLERARAEREAARSSALLVELGGKGREPVTGDRPVSSQLPTSEAAAGTADQQRRLDFFRSSGSDVNPHRMKAAPSPFTLSAGTVIPASLVTGINSDLPGMVIAQVTENVFDSATGRTLLVPQGARLIGSYDSQIAFGQRRALVLWSRILFPNGASIRIEDMPATDPSGYAGLADKVDFHAWQLLKGAALSTLLGVGTELSLGNEEGDLLRALREATQQSASRTGEVIVSRNLDVQPTITVRPGWPVRAVLHQDLIFEPWTNEL